MENSTLPHVSSLAQSFAAVPPAAAAAVVDCVLSSASLSPSLLFHSLLDSFPNPNNSNLDSRSNQILSFTSALCHLVERISENQRVAVQELVWKVFVPLLESVDTTDSQLIIELEGLLCNVVVRTLCWDTVGMTLVRSCLRSVGSALNMTQSTEMAVYKWSNEGILDKECGAVVSRILLLPVACGMLTSLLESALRNNNDMQMLEQSADSECSITERFLQNVIWDISAMTVAMLRQSPELRSAAIQFFLPLQFYKKIWNCCLSLFSLGHPERLDAYRVLSLYLSSLHDEKSRNDFDIGEEKEFWEEIRRGLVDRDQSVRKQALYILKISLRIYFSTLRSQNGECLVQASALNSNKNSVECKPSCASITKREKWATKEAKSIGVGEVCQFNGHYLSSQDRWKVFLLLYEMLEEYGTHLVEAAWTHQVSLLFQCEFASDHVYPDDCEIYQEQMGSLSGIFRWLAILWERGLFHDNRQVRSFIMQSFLDVSWSEHKSYVRKVPRSFILGPFVLGLNDVVHHKDFGVKGVYISESIQGSRKFFNELFCQLSLSESVALLYDLASVGKNSSFSRAGLMALATCIGSAASQSCNEKAVDKLGSLDEIYVQPAQECYTSGCHDLLDVLGSLIERSKQHFNPNYRIQVCEQVLKAVCSVINIYNVPVAALLHFIATIPQEFTDVGGRLRGMVQLWLSDIRTLPSGASLVDMRTHIIQSLLAYQMRFLKSFHSESNFIAFDDEDVDAWSIEAQRWARLLFLVVTQEHHLEDIFTSFESFFSIICKQCDGKLDLVPAKLLLLMLGLIEEFRTGWTNTCSSEAKANRLLDTKYLQNQVSSPFTSVFNQSLIKRILYCNEYLLTFAKLVSPTLWSASIVKDTNLPSSVKGKLGGPTQRRLAPMATSAVLEAVISVRAVSVIVSLFNEFGMDDSLDSSYVFLLDFVQKTFLYQTYDSETVAEFHLAAYEALAYVFKALCTFNPRILKGFIISCNESSSFAVGGKCLLDPLLLSFIKNINDFLDVGLLTRSRRAVLLNWKWICLDSLLAVPYTIEGDNCYYFNEYCCSDATLWTTLADIIGSLESAGESSVLPMLRSVRSVIGLLYSDRLSKIYSSSAGIDTELMLQLVTSSWILHLSCNKRRVAPIAALLSTILHPSIFSDLSMHETNAGKEGPLKWFVGKLIEEGEKSPRMIRLAALHLTGLWLRYPKTIRYYIKELKQLCLYGSVAFDEDFEAELFGNFEARSEFPSLAQSPDPELTEVFINTEMYARVSVGVLFHSLARLAKANGNQANEDSVVSLHCGKMFLIELLDAAVNDKDLSKELYKKYNAVHRRKVRVWQMICLLSHFVDEEIVKQVTSKLHICLYRNNLPAVRQYLEKFAILIYLNFPMLAEDELVPIFSDYNMKPQALSSYVFVAANLIVHTKDSLIQAKHLHELLPAIIPLLTSHHHSLRGFTQLLVYYVLCKLRPSRKSELLVVGAVEMKSFDNLSSYLAKNADCVRLRSSMEGFLDAFDPIACATPAGIYDHCNEGSCFECVPLSLMEQVINFLNDVREDLRSSIAKDEVAIKREMLTSGDVLEDLEETLHSDKERKPSASKDLCLDFQKKITLYTLNRQQVHGDIKHGSGNSDIPRLLRDVENEDLLLAPVVQSRNQAMQMLRQSQQEFILVASFIDRIPNLAGLARTCEVFKAAGLAVADATIVQDRQFQLISVTAEKWVPIIEVPVGSLKFFLEKKRKEGFSILGLEQTANSTPLDKFSFSNKTVMVLGQEKEGIPVDIIHVLDACVEIPQLGIIRSLNVHVSGAIALWEYTRQQRLVKSKPLE